jgi:hypothetical protein
MDGEERRSRTIEKTGAFAAWSGWTPRAYIVEV